MCEHCNGGRPGTGEECRGAVNYAGLICFFVHRVSSYADTLFRSPTMARRASSVSM